MRNQALVLLLLVAACSNSHGPVLTEAEQALQRIQPCVEGQAETFLGSLSEMGDLLQLFLSQESFLQQTTGITPTGDPTVWGFALGGLSGTATFSHDPAEEFVTGDTVTLDWVFESGTVAGSGVFDLELTSPTTIELKGMGSFVDGACTMDVTIDDPDPLVFDVAGLGALAADFGGIGVTGMVGISVGLPPDLFTGTLAIPAEGDILINGGSANGFSVAPFLITTGGGGGGGGGPSVALQNWGGTWLLDWRCAVTDPNNPNFHAKDCNVDLEVERDANGVPRLDANGFPIPLVPATPRLDANGNTIWVFDERCNAVGTERITITQNASDPNKLDLTFVGTGIPVINFTIEPTGSTVTFTLPWTDANGFANEEDQTWTLTGNDSFEKLSSYSVVDGDGNTVVTGTCEGRARRLP